MKTGVVLTVCLLVAPLLPALETEVSVQTTRTEVLAAAGPGAPLVQTGVDDLLLQGAVSHRQTLTEGWNLSGTVWGSLDTLPSGSPLVVPAPKVEVSGQILEALLTAEVVPGVVVLDAGKKVLHPSSGFSAAPLNFVDRGGTKVGAQAVAKWEQGWIQAGQAWMAPWATLSNSYSPGWGGVFRQSGWFDQSRIGWRWDPADFQVVTLVGDQGLQAAGFGLDTGWGDNLTLRAEGAWKTGVTQALAGATYTGADSSTFMAEYSWDSTAAKTAHHGFLRATRSLDDKVDGEAWGLVNLVDGSGFGGLAATVKLEKASLILSLQDAWGVAGSPGGDSPLLWKAGVEFQVFL